MNGDDGIRIILDADASVVDQYGADGVDGTGTVWEYKDGFAKRNNGTGPDGTFVEGNWTYALSGLDGGGSCQGGETFETIMGGIGTYTTQGSTEPSIAITYPANGATLALGTTEIEVTFVTNNFEVGETTAGLDGHVHYYLNGNMLGMHYSNDPIAYTGLVPGTHTIKLQLVDNSHQPLNPDVYTESTFTIPSASEVATIAELRACATDGSVYTLTGEAILTMQQTFRHQKWIEDSTAAILIDDNAGVITSEYNRYDGISGISGSLQEYNGVLQFVPTEDPGAATSSGNTVTPQVVSIIDFNANPDMYESELVKFENVRTDATGNWETGTTYTFMGSAVPEDILKVRTNFYSANYIDTPLPNKVIHLVGIAGEYKGAAQMYPRDSMDIIDNLGVNNMWLNPKDVTVVVLNNTLHIKGFDAENVKSYNLQGKMVSTSTFVGELASGTYVAVMTNKEGQTISVKFIKK